MRFEAGLRARSVATTSAIVALGLSCDLSRIALPPADRVVWKVHAATFGVAPSFDSTTVYFASRNHEIVAIDRHSSTVRWRSNTGLGIPETGGYNSVVAGAVVVLSDGNLYAFDRATGAAAWSYRASDGDATGGGTLATDGSTVYASSLLGRVYAVDARTGLPLWIAQLPGPDSVRVSAFDPAVAHGQLFAGYSYATNPSSGGLAALDAATGHLLWMTHFVPRAIGQESSCTTAPVVTDGLVIASSNDGQIFGLDTATGAIRWTSPSVPRYPTGDVRGLALSNNVVIATSYSGFATGIDAATGVVRWQPQIDGSSQYAQVSADAQIAVFSNNSNEIIVVNPQNGEVAWRTGLGKEGGDFWGYTAVAPDAVFANGFEAFYALKR